MNYILVIGRVLREPVYKPIGGRYVMNIQVESLDGLKSEIHDVSMFMDYHMKMKPNDMISVEGKIRTMAYEDASGNKVCKTGITAEKIEVIK